MFYMALNVFHNMNADASAVCCTCVFVSVLIFALATSATGLHNTLQQVGMKFTVKPYSGSKHFFHVV